MKLSINTSNNDPSCLEMSFNNKNELDIKIFNTFIASITYRVFLNDQEASNSLNVELENLLQAKQQSI